MKILLLIIAYAVAICSTGSLYLTVFRSKSVGLEKWTNFATVLYFLAIITVAVALIVKLYLE